MCLETERFQTRHLRIGRAVLLLLGGSAVGDTAQRGIDRVEIVNENGDLERDAAPNRGLHDLVSDGTHCSADNVNAEFPDGYSSPHTPGTQASEFITDGNQAFVCAVSGDILGDMWGNVSF